jgi:predicted ribosomally synthesized peptide with nif11-like leader
MPEEQAQAFIAKMKTGEAFHAKVMAVKDVAAHQQLIDDEGETIHDLDALEMPAAEGVSETRLPGKRLRDYYVLAASVRRRAYALRWRPRRAVGEGYVGAGAGASPEVEDRKSAKPCGEGPDRYLKDAAGPHPDPDPFG